VTLTDETEKFGMLALEGPNAAAVIREVSGVNLARLDELSSMDGTVASIPCRIVKRSPGGIAGSDFIVERGKLTQLWEILLTAARKHGGGPAGYTAMSGRRLALGVPWFGYDFGERQIPHEAALEHSHISYTKGCYTGQEIVERVRSRGQVNRRRVELVFSGNTVPEAGAPLTLDGKEVGYVTRAAKIPLGATGEATQVIGMGYARKEANAAGTTLQWAHGTATVTQSGDRAQ
jgi:aminomethyltransferase